VAVLAVLAFSCAILAGWHYLAELPGAHFEIGDRPHTATTGGGEHRAFALGSTTTHHALAGATRVAVDNPYGNVALLPGGAEAEVKQALYARGWSREAAKQEARGVHLVVVREGDALAIRVEGPRRTARVGVDLTVRLPDRLPVRATTTDGDIAAHQLRGTVELRSVSGDLYATGLGAGLSARTTSGDLRAEGVPGGIDAHTVSGDLTAEQTAGRATVSSVSGDVTLHAESSLGINASSTSGNLDLETRQAFTGHLSAQSVSGDVTIALGPGSSCQVRMSSVSGSTNNGLGSLSGAPGLVEARTVSGDIEVRAADR